MQDFFVKPIDWLVHSIYNGYLFFYLIYHAQIGNVSMFVNNTLQEGKIKKELYTRNLQNKNITFPKPSLQY